MFEVIVKLFICLFCYDTYSNCITNIFNIVILFRFSRSVGISNNGQDLNLDNSLWIIRGYRTQRSKSQLVHSMLYSLILCLPPCLYDFYN